MENDFFDSYNDFRPDCNTEVYQLDDDIIVSGDDDEKKQRLECFLDKCGFELLDGISFLKNDTFKILFNINNGCLHTRFKTEDAVLKFFEDYGFKIHSCKKVKLNLQSQSSRYYKVIIENESDFFSKHTVYIDKIPEKIRNTVTRKKKIEKTISKVTDFAVILFLLLILFFAGISIFGKSGHQEDVTSKPLLYDSLDDIYKEELLEDFDSLAVVPPSLRVKKELEKVPEPKNYEFDYTYNKYDIEIVDNDGNRTFYKYSRYDIDGNNLVIEGYMPDYYDPISFTILDKRTVKTISGRKCFDEDEK